jgi:hypothetical protein
MSDKEYMCALPGNRSAEILGSDPSRGWAAANGCPPEIAKKIIEYRSAIIAGKDEVEARSAFAHPVSVRPEKRSSHSKLSQRAWDQFVKDPKRFAEKHGVPALDDSRERRIQILNSIL